MNEIVVFTMLVNSSELLTQRSHGTNKKWMGSSDPLLVNCSIVGVYPVCPTSAESEPIAQQSGMSLISLSICREIGFGVGTTHITWASIERDVVNPMCPKYFSKHE